MLVYTSFREHWKKVDDSYKVTLYPKYGLRATTGTRGGAQAVYTPSKPSPWMDIADIVSGAIESINGQQLHFLGLNHLAATETEIEGQAYITYQFRGKRNAQTYDP